MRHPNTNLAAVEGSPPLNALRSNVSHGVVYPFGNGHSAESAFGCEYSPAAATAAVLAVVLAGETDDPVAAACAAYPPGDFGTPVSLRPGTTAESVAAAAPAAGAACTAELAAAAVAAGTRSTCAHQQSTYATPHQHDKT